MRRLTCSGAIAAGDESAMFAREPQAVAGTCRMTAAATRPSLEEKMQRKNARAADESRDGLAIGLVNARAARVQTATGGGKQSTPPGRTTAGGEEDRRRSERLPTGEVMTGARMVAGSPSLVEIDLDDASLHGIGGKTISDLSIGDRFTAALPCKGGNRRVEDDGSLVFAGFRVSRCEPAGPPQSRWQARRIGADLVSSTRSLKEGFLLPDDSERRAVRAAALGYDPRQAGGEAPGPSFRKAA